MRDAAGIAGMLGAILLPHPQDLVEAAESGVDKLVGECLGEAYCQAKDSAESSFWSDVEHLQKTLLPSGYEHLLESAIGAVATGVTTVGVRGPKGDAVGVGFEDIKSPSAHGLMEVLENEFGSDISFYETGRITAQASVQQVYDPVVPGCAISSVKDSFGTLGAIVWGQHLGSAVISNSHVLNRTQGGVVWQPEFRGSGARRIGKVYQAVSPAVDEINTFDGAIAELAEDVTYNPRPEGFAFGPLRNSRVAPGTRCAKLGASTGLTFGVVDQFETRIAAWYGKKLMHFARQYQIKSSGEGLFSTYGDSGSIVATTDMWQPFGLLFAGNREYSWASPLEAALVSFDVSLAGD